MRIPIDSMEQQELAVFTYPVADILLEANKRSSYIGKMRGDKENADFIDRMALTEAESFLSEDMLKDAMEQVYEWLAAFGKGVENAHEITTLSESDDESTGDDELYLVFTLQPRPWWDRNAFSRVERYIKEALVNYILARWFEYTNAQESTVFQNKFEEYAQKAQLGMNAENGVLERRFNTPFNTIFG